MNVESGKLRVESQELEGRAIGFPFSTLDSRSSNDCDAPYALCGSPQPATFNSRPSRGFTLLEVMIAMAVFFIVVFAVLGMVVQSLGAARALQVQHPDCGMLAAMLSLSNTLEEGFESDDFEEVFPNYRWERQITEIGTNFFQVEFFIFKKDARGKQAADRMMVYMHKPTGRRRR